MIPLFLVGLLVAMAVAYSGVVTSGVSPTSSRDSAIGRDEATGDQNGHQDLEVGDNIGSFEITSVVSNVYAPGSIAGLRTQGEAVVFGSFFLSPLFGEHCFSADVNHPQNRGRLPVNADSLGRNYNHYTFCFYKPDVATEDDDLPWNAIPSTLLLKEYGVLSVPVMIRVKDFRIDRRELGVSDDAVFVEVVGLR